MSHDEVDHVFLGRREVVKPLYLQTEAIFGLIGVSVSGKHSSLSQGGTADDIVQLLVDF